MDVARITAHPALLAVAREAVPVAAFVRPPAARRWRELVTAVAPAARTSAEMDWERRGSGATWAAADLGTRVDIRI